MHVLDSALSNVAFNFLQRLVVLETESEAVER
jgi:hypothetical protein